MTKTTPQFVINSLLIKFALAFLLTALVGFVAIHLADSFYAVAPFHYDAASYWLGASDYYEFYKLKGLVATLSDVIFIKDSLDITLRLLFAPYFLHTLYGHMAILLPFMGLFIFFIIHYVYSRTNSWLLSLAAIAFLFSFPVMYNPYMGIADYWKDTIAVWILGSAIVSWLLSNELTNRGWSFLSGLLLGLLVMQRSCLAVYAVPMFLPLFLWVGYQRIKSDGFENGVKRIFVFAAPVIFLFGFVAITQWKKLHDYYSIIAYAIYPHFEIVKIIYQNSYSLNYEFFGFFIGFPLLLLIAVYLMCFFCSVNWKQQRKDILVAVWMVLCFPFAVIAGIGPYMGFGVVFSVLLIVLLATFIPPSFSSVDRLRKFALVLIILAVSASVLQFKLSNERSSIMAKNSAVWRDVYSKLINVIVAQPAPRYVSILFDELMRGPFSVQAKVNNGIAMGSPDGIVPVGYMSVHDSYYRYYQSDAKDWPIQKYVDKNVKSLEKHNGTLAITYCDPKAALRSPVFTDMGSGEHIAVFIAVAQAKYLLNNSHWKRIDKLSSPYGELCIYRYSKSG